MPLRRLRQGGCAHSCACEIETSDPRLPRAARRPVNAASARGTGLRTGADDRRRGRDRCVFARCGGNPASRATFGLRRRDSESAEPFLRERADLRRNIFRNARLRRRRHGGAASPKRHCRVYGRGRLLRPSLPGSAGIATRARSKRISSNRAASRTRKAELWWMFRKRL